MASCAYRKQNCLGAFLYSQFHHHPLDDVSAVVDAAGIVALQQASRAVRMDRQIGRYIVDLANATRQPIFMAFSCAGRSCVRRVTPG